MTATRALSLFARVLPLLAAAGCAAGSLMADGPPGGPVAIDLLVIPPSGSDVPAQIVSGLGADEVGDGEHNLQLDAGTDVTFHIRSTDQIPIDDAAVRIRMRGAVGYDVVEVTGATGNVTLPLGAATYDIEVDPDSALYPTLPPRLFRGLVVPPNGTEMEQTLTLEPGYRIRGTLRDSAGAALQQWQVAARLSTDNEARSTAATTSMVGTFEIFVPSTGTWVLEMSPPPLATGQPTARHIVDVGADIEGYVFQFPALETHTVSGVVSGIGGLTTDFSNVTVRARAPQLLTDMPEPGVTISFNGSTTTDATGFFSMPVLEGTYTLSIEPVAGFEYSHTVVPNLEVLSDVTLVESLTSLYPKVSVGGAAVDAVTSEGTEGARVRLISADGTTSYQFSDPDGTSGTGAFEILANVGSYTAEVLPAPGSGLVRTKQSVTVAAAIADLSVGLVPGQVVGGKVYDADGNALELVTIVALDPETAEPVGSDEALSSGGGSWTLTVPFLDPAQ